MPSPRPPLLGVPETADVLGAVAGNEAEHVTALVACGLFVEKTANRLGFLHDIAHEPCTPGCPTHGGGNRTNVPWRCCPALTRRLSPACPRTPGQRA
ncbi:hypothetical protein BN6_22240 [Saccharothrix espanaensis DSM 44229]|uniref:Uncharacterized protein n=1 Tax=Saccharothrix espanaensis (strain ATCC 51144 / DSM 44229 / JCM 9112 / NBRC 15066 / NRRL 15764) TaxID=1179773 RepID=K0JQE0_SACES|nr:hypothetical protein BN6_22240 [Saccharothrix espanaensis DSM 44229]